VGSHEFFLVIFARYLKNILIVNQFGGEKCRPDRGWLNYSCPMYITGVRYDFFFMLVGVRNDQADSFLSVLYLTEVASARHRALP